jgi:Asp-tRNA(Asn)/Glu-tRNA(Gln) amidotransferase A subunit family amidase
VSSGIDALLLPVTPWVGYKPKTWVVSKQWLGYTALYNLLNYAAVTVPVATADPELDDPRKDEEWSGHVPRNESDRFNHQQCMFSPWFCFAVWSLGETNERIDDIHLVKGMPVTVQIVGGRFGEERAVSVGKVVDQVFGRR